MSGIHVWEADRIFAGKREAVLTPILRMNILLVEDQDDSRKTLSRLIEMRGHKITQVATAEEAERAVATDTFPFLILDWMLPGKSGIELCRQLRARQDGDEMFILLVTGKTDRADLEMALEAGANDYLTKPIDLSLLNVRLAVAERQIRDLTERNHARIALQQSARTLTDTLENTTDGLKFMLADQDWLLIRFSGTEPIMRFYTETTRRDKVQPILQAGLALAGLQST